jgi:protein TonB
MQELEQKETVGRRHEQSPAALLAVIALHIVALALLLHYQPGLSSAMSQVLNVSMITLPQALPVEAVPEPPKPKPVRKAERITPPAPIAIPNQTAISAPPAPPAAEVVASAPPAPPAPPAPIVLPRFDADYLQNPAPLYPSMARRMGEQGRVLLRVVVRPDGTPDAVVLRQSSGSQRLDEAALEAVRKWRFVPAKQGSTPVTAAVIVPIVFSLEG